MKKITVLSVVVAMIMGVFLPGCSGKVSEEDMTKKREEAIAKSSVAIEEVAVKSKMPEVAEIVKFYKATSFLIMPVGCDDAGNPALRMGEKLPDTAYTIAVTALFPEDRNLCEYWKKAYDGETYAFLFIEQGSKKTSLLVIKEYPISRIWRGIVAIHEISHAVEHAMDVFSDIKDPELKNAYRELDTYTLVGEILKNIGGSEYENLLDKETRRVAEELKKNSFTSPQYNLYSVELEKIFGKPESEKEAALRMDTLWAEANLNLCDKKYGKKIAGTKEKLIFMMDINSRRNFMKQ